MANTGLKYTGNWESYAYDVDRSEVILAVSKHYEVCAQAAYDTVNHLQDNVRIPLEEGPAVLDEIKKLTTMSPSTWWRRAYGTTVGIRQELDA